MAARSDISPARWRGPFLHWLDGIAGWAIPLLLVGFIAVWLAFLVIAYFGGDLHPDVLETWTLGRTFEWGYSKHPPLMGWVARAWMSVFPLTNWSFQLMAMTNSAIALWGVDLISRHFVKGDKRAIVLLLLMVTPIYQLYAQRFNAAGAKVGSEFRVNTTTAGDQKNSAVAMDAAGDFVISWMGPDQKLYPEH